MRPLPLLALPLIATTAMAADTFDRGPGLPGDRQGDTTAWHATNFDKVGFGLAGTVEVRVGPAWSVRASGPAAAFANLRIVSERGSLNIGRRYNNREDSAVERQIHFVVTLPHLSGVSLGGSGRMSVDRVPGGGTFDASLGGSGSITLGTLQVERAQFSIGGSGNIAAQGSAHSIKVSLGGSGNLQAPGLRANSAEVSSAGSGGVRATIDGPATVSVVGSGTVDLGARAHCAVSKMGHAQVRCGS